MIKEKEDKLTDDNVLKHIKYKSENTMKYENYKKGKSKWINIRKIRYTRFGTYNHSRMLK